MATLPRAQLQVLEPKVEYFALPSGRVLYEPGDTVRHVFFPTSGIVSLLNIDERGDSTQLSLVGLEGMVGLEALLGADSAASRAFVQTPASAYRLSVREARMAFAQGDAFQEIVLRYAHALLLELAQTAVCNLRHGVQQQLCRWLLLCLDRIGGDDVEMTHELIAAVLGVRRQGISEAARRLRERGIIRYQRGRITVLDRGALEESACECYRALRPLPAFARSVRVSVLRPFG